MGLRYVDSGHHAENDGEKKRDGSWSDSREGRCMPGKATINAVAGIVRIRAHSRFLPVSSIGHWRAAEPSRRVIIDARPAQTHREKLPIFAGLGESDDLLN